MRISKKKGVCAIGYLQMNKHEIDLMLMRISNGDNVAFEKLYTETKRGVYAFLYSYLGNREDCEDAMQDVYLKIKMNILQYKAGSNGLAWILQIAKNTALNAIRANKNNEKKLYEAQSAELNFAERAEQKNTVLAAMDRVLDGEEQRIVILHVVWGYKHKETANVLNCPIGTVTSKYKRSVEKLKIALKEEQL